MGDVKTTGLGFWTNRCKHQATEGLPERCKAGVRYADLVPDEFGRMLRLPCFLTSRSYDVVPCERLSRYTEAEAIAERDAIDRAMVLLLDGKSPCCEAVLTETPVGTRSVVMHCAKCGVFVARGCREIGESNG